MFSFFFPNIAVKNTCFPVAFWLQTKILGLEREVLVQALGKKHGNKSLSDVVDKVFKCSPIPVVFTGDRRAKVPILFYVYANTVEGK